MCVEVRRQLGTTCRSQYSSSSMYVVRPDSRVTDCYIYLWSQPDGLCLTFYIPSQSALQRFCIAASEWCLTRQKVIFSVLGNLMGLELTYRS